MKSNSAPMCLIVPVIRSCKHLLGNKLPRALHYTLHSFVTLCGRKWSEFISRSVSRLSASQSHSTSFPSRIPSPPLPVPLRAVSAHPSWQAAAPPLPRSPSVPTRPDRLPSPPLPAAAPPAPVRKSCLTHGLTRRRGNLVISWLLVP